jgi:hypothetical protein
VNNPKTSLIITSISAPNKAMKLFAEKSLQNNIEFIVIGDLKSPADFNLEGCKFYSIDEQEKLPFTIAKILPKKHYSRKNIGYLLSAHQEIILETDDDNFPRDEFWNSRNKTVSASVPESTGWNNVYNYFSEDSIWPRGFPLENILSKNPSLRNQQNILCPVQQGLADENPDVDAVYRMCKKLPIDFKRREPVALGKNIWCPFNSQNTTWFKEAFPLLYLPSYCSFRMTDIWRSFVVQRIAWTCEWSILFHNASVWQERNEHNLLKDFEDEVPGYLNNSKICKMLEDLDLKPGIKNMSENLFRCYSMLTENNFIKTEEMPLVEAWIKDIEKIIPTSV